MRLTLAAAIFVLACSPAMAGTERCSEPYAPVIPDGASASADDMAVLKSEVQQYIADSDAYQDCILAVIADPAEKMTPADKKKAQDLIFRNQKEKESVGAAYREALKTHKTAHGG